MDDQLDFRAYWRIFQRWWWVLLLGMVTAGAVAYYVTSSEPPIYEATAKVLVQRGASGAQPLPDIQASEQLATSYGDLIKTRPILEQVIDTLALPYGAGRLSGKTAIKSPRSLIEITVADRDPEMAALLANTIATTFIDDFRDKQLLQIAQFQVSLAQYGITDDPSIVAAQIATLSTLRLAEEAIPSSSPSGPGNALVIGIAVIVGLIIAGGLIFLLESLDDRIKSAEEIKTLTGLTTLGSVLRYRTRDSDRSIDLSDNDVHSAMAESYRFLRTNLRFAALGAEEGLKTLLVTSSTPAEGKTTTAANLSIIMAQEGKSVILVDSDLRRPSLHKFFGLDERKGLTNMVLGEASLDEVLAQTAVDGLQLLPSGPVPPDATVILSSSKMKDVVEELRRSADMVIFDSPPLLVVTDPMILASLLDGTVLVVDTQRARRDTVKRGVQHLQQATQAYMGVVLNKVSIKDAGSGYYYQYYGGYYGHNGSEKKNGRKIGPLGLLPKVLRNGMKRRMRSSSDK